MNGGSGGLVKVVNCGCLCLMFEVKMKMYLINCQIFEYFLQALLEQYPQVYLILKNIMKKNII